MFVRTMYITADPAMVGPALDVLAKEAPGMLAEQHGYQGLGVFADRAVGKILVGSWWDSEQAMQDSDAQLKDRRGAMLAPFVSTISIMNLEAVAFDRAPSTTTGGFRLQRMMFDPADADKIVGVFKDFGLARLQAISGYSGATMLMNRDRGMASVGVVYQTMDALEASRAEQAGIRKEALSRVSSAQLFALEEFEVADLETPTK